MDFKSRFAIGECPGAPGHWYVDWTELGPVEKDIAKYKLCEIVFDKIQVKWKLGVGYNVQYYKPANPSMLLPRTTPRKPNDPVPEEVFRVVEDTRWEVQWISFDGWIYLQDYQRETFITHLFRSRTPRHEVTGIVLETLDQAEQFVDLMEAQFTFYTLKRTHANEW
jgi:hypothetical protein